MKKLICLFNRTFSNKGKKVIQLLSSGVIDDAAYTDAVVTSIFNTNELSIIAGAINGTIASNDVYVYNTTTGVRITKYTAPFDPRADCPYSLLGGKLTIIGGDGNTTPGEHGFHDIWQFDPASGNNSGAWTQINSDFRPAIGERILSFFCDLDGWFYIGCGQTQTDIYKTQDFTSWTFVCTVPTDFRWTQTAACVPFNGKILVMGGGTETATFGSTALYFSTLNGAVWEIDPSTCTVTILTTNQYIFGCLWGKAIVAGGYIYYVRGAIHSNQLPQFPPDTVAGNQLGVYRSQDGISWELFSHRIPATHAIGVAEYNNDVWFGTGNQVNNIYFTTNI